MCFLPLLLLLLHQICLRIYFETLSIIFMKLNDNNYLLWAHSFMVFLVFEEKLRTYFEGPPSEKDSTCPDWLANDYCIITWLLNRVEKNVSFGVIFLKTANKIWNTLKEVYGNEKNIFRVFELYEHLFTPKQGDISVSKYHFELRETLGELDIYQPLVIDFKTFWQ